MYAYTSGVSIIDFQTELNNIYDTRKKPLLDKFSMSFSFTQKSK